MMNIDYLNSWKEQVDRVDTEILFLLKRRLQLQKKVFKYKMDNEITTQDKNREDEVLNNVKGKARSMGMSEGFVRNMFEELLKESEKRRLIFIEEMEMKNKSKK